MASAEQSEKPTVFVSYSHKDKKWLDSILPQLKAAQRYGHFEVWSDLEIRNEPDAARERLGKARALVEETGCHRRDRDITEIEKALGAAAAKKAPQMTAD